MSIEGIDDSCEQSSSVLRRGKRKTSTVWDLFTQIPIPSSDGKFRAICKACEKNYILHPSSGTSNLKRHLDTINKNAKEHQSTPIDQATFREKMSIAIRRHSYPFSGCVFCLETENVEAAVAKAVSAGAVSDGEIAEAEEGAACCSGRVGKLKDPFGNVLVICSPAV